MVETTTPRIWIGCLASYNSGRLHGEWFDADVDADELWGYVDQVLKTSPIPGAEEWFVADYEGFGDIKLGEYPSLAKVSMIAQLIADKGTAAVMWLENDESPLDYCDDIHDLTNEFEKQWRGEWENEEAFAYSEVQSLGLPGAGFLTSESGERWSQILDQIEYYLDWDAITKTMTDDYTVLKKDYKTIYVFDTSA